MSSGPITGSAPGTGCHTASSPNQRHDTATRRWSLALHVFVYKDVEVHNQSLPMMHFMESLGHHVVVKNVAKTRFLFGLAHMLAKTTQVSSFVNLQDRLGDILMWLQTMESLALAAVEGAWVDPPTACTTATPPP